MKKVISSILSLAMMLSMSTVAFAQTNEFVLTYSNEPSYQITIPDSSNIDVSTGKSTIDIAVSDANLAEGTAVSVSISSANYENDSWYLVNTKDNDDKIAYNIGTTDGGDDISSGDRVIVTTGTNDTTLYVTINDTSKVGTFTDIITFTSEIINNEITFFVQGINYNVTAGTTWEDWVNSSANTWGYRERGGELVDKDGVNIWGPNGTIYITDIIIDGFDYMPYEDRFE